VMRLMAFGVLSMLVFLLGAIVFFGGMFGA